MLLRCLAVSLLLLALALAPSSDGPLQPTPGGDLAVFTTTVAAMQHGSGYYPAMRDALVRYGFPSAHVANWRLPLVYTLLATIPGARWLLPLGVALLGAWAAWTWQRPAILLGTANVAIMLAVPAAAFLTEPWAGMLVAAALLLVDRAPRAAIGCVVLACACRELAVVALLVVLWETRQERRAWTVALLALGLYGGWHSWEVWHWQPPDAWGGPSWLAFSGPGFLLATFRTSALGLVAPLLMAAITGLAWLAPTFPRGLRWTLAGYALAFLVVGRPDNHYWGFVLAPSVGIAAGWTREGLAAVGSLFAVRQRDAATIRT